MKLANLRTMDTGHMFYFRHWTVTREKNNDEGIDFYYMGDLMPIKDAYEQTTMSKGDGTSVSVVKIIFEMKNPVSSSMYDYITDHN